MASNRIRIRSGSSEDQVGHVSRCVSVSKENNLFEDESDYCFARDLLRGYFFGHDLCLIETWQCTAASIVARCGRTFFTALDYLEKTSGGGRRFVNRCSNWQGNVEMRIDLTRR